jgi:hypothetical protein
MSAVRYGRANVQMRRTALPDSRASRTASGSRPYIQGPPCRTTASVRASRPPATGPETGSRLGPETYRRADGDETVAHARSHQWNHGLAEVVTAVLDQGLRLDRLEEHDWTTYEGFEWLHQCRAQRFETPPGPLRMPRSHTLVATLRDE